MSTTSIKSISLGALYVESNQDVAELAKLIQLHENKWNGWIPAGIFVHIEIFGRFARLLYCALPILTRYFRCG